MDQEISVVNETEKHREVTVADERTHAKQDSESAEGNNAGKGQRRPDKLHSVIIKQELLQEAIAGDYAMKEVDMISSNSSIGMATGSIMTEDSSTLTEVQEDEGYKVDRDNDGNTTKRKSSSPS